MSRLVALPAHLANARNLLSFEPRVDAEDLDRYLFVDCEVVDPDHDPELPLELLLIAKRGVGHLLLEKARLDRRNDPAEVFDALEVDLRLALHLIGQRLDEIAAAERVDRVRHAPLVP